MAYFQYIDAVAQHAATSRASSSASAGPRGRQASADPRALVLGVPTNQPGLVLAGRSGVALALGGRAVLGLTGNTQLVAPGEVSESFRRWDRRLYTPLCLALSAGAARAIALDR